MVSSTWVSAPPTNCEADAVIRACCLVERRWLAVFEPPAVGCVVLLEDAFAFGAVSAARAFFFPFEAEPGLAEVEDLALEDGLTTEDAFATEDDFATEDGFATEVGLTTEDGFATDEGFDF